MARYFSPMLPFAAAAVAVIALSTAQPASAAESKFGANELGRSSVRAVSHGVRHRTAQRVRFVGSRDFRRDRYAPAAFWGRGCYDGSWCGRQFVLMIGIGY